MAKRKAGTLSNAAKQKREPEPTITEPAVTEPAAKEKDVKFEPTSTGYKKADGTNMQRLSLFLTIDQIAEIKSCVGKANQSISNYIADQLGL